MTYKNIIHLQEWKHHKNKSGLVLIFNRSKFQTFISFMMVILVTITAIIVHNHTKKIFRFPSQLKLNNIIATRSLEVFTIENEQNVHVQTLMKICMLRDEVSTYINAPQCISKDILKIIFGTNK